MDKSKENSEIWKDSRFAHLVGDPRFKQLAQSQKKIKIDDRFQSMFTNKKFKVNYSVDKYGRKVNKTSNEDLNKFYELDSESDDDEDDENKDDDKNEVEKKIKPKDIFREFKELNVDYARGEGVPLTDSSDDSSDDEDNENDELFIEHVWGELDQDADHTEESSKRLAACNMNWDRMRAVDIMVLCNSFLPSDGCIKSVTIYPSEYGKQRIEEEEKLGPQELRETNEIQNDEDDEEGSSYHMEKLRQYQLNRLKYYYAVIEFDSVKTAEFVYKECDGLEYESTATKLDLRFIPDDMTFDDEPHDKCTELPNLTKYQPRTFITSALQQSKVELTWDESDIGRKELTSKIFSTNLNEIDEDELKNYVAFSSDDEDDKKNEKIGSNDSISQESDDEDHIMKYKKLLEEIKEDDEEKKKKSFERELTWSVNVPDVNTKTQTKKTKLTPFEQIVEKKKEKTKMKKLKRRKDNGKKDDEDEDSIPDDIDMNDPYFAEEFMNDEFKSNKKKDKMKNKQKNEEENDEDEERNGLALLVEDDKDGRNHFSLEKIQKNEMKSKKKKKKHGNVMEETVQEDNFQINVDDKRFDAVYNSHLFNIDPTDPHFKKTKGIETIIDEKLKRKRNRDDGDLIEDKELNPPSNVKRKDPALNLLVKNIKRKSMKN